MRFLAACVLALVLPATASAAPVDRIVGPPNGTAYVLRALPGGATIALWHDALARIEADGSIRQLSPAMEHPQAVALPEGYAILEDPEDAARPPRVLRFDSSGAPVGNPAVLPTPRGAFWTRLYLGADARGRVFVKGDQIADPWQGIGSVALRFAPDNAPDVGFGEGGTARLPYVQDDTVPVAAVLPDGGFVLAEHGQPARLHRFTASGQSARRASVRARHDDEDYGALLPLRGGRLLVESHTYGRHGHITRLRPDGRRDPAFREIRTPRDYAATAHSLALDSRRRIVVVINHGDWDWLEVRRYLPDGRRDRSFTPAEIRPARGWTGTVATSLVIDRRDRIVVGGWMADGEEIGKFGTGRPHPFVVRLEG